VIVYIGASTGEGKAEGISVFRLDEGTGALAHIQSVAAENPSFVALHPQGTHLYAVTRSGGAGGGSSSVEAYAIDPSDHTLTFLNRVASGGASPAHVSVHPSGKSVYAANYGSGHAASFPVREDGSLGEAASAYLHDGYEGFKHPGPNARRQEGPHAHFITPDPTGARVLSCDLGCDRVFVYTTDAANGKMTPNEVPYAQVPSGAGPRHLSFHPSGRFVYVINEIACTISAFTYDERGALQIVDTQNTLPVAREAGHSTAQIVVHPNGRYVYGSNRGHHSIAIFEIDQQTGRLTPRGHESTQGKTPRNFNINPSGTLLLAANQDTNTIVAFTIDGETGKLTATGQITETPSPTCVVFLAKG